MNYRTAYRHTPRRHRSHRILTVLLATLMLGSYSYYALSRALPRLLPSASSLSLQTRTGVSQLTWPTIGQSAVGVEGTSILQSHGTQSPVAIASVAKVITALTVLQQKPLALGQSGPTITLTASDAALYNSYVTRGGSVVPVASGEQITERQMLEAMMLPSANNMADSLAIWAFGSLSTYQVYASHYVAYLGLHDTHIGNDASGFSPTTTSTARDLVILGEQAMDNPALRLIVSQASTTDIPMAGSVSNINMLLGKNNIIGIKTGNTDQAGGVYLSASTTVIDKQTMTVITVLAGAPTLFQAFQDSLPLITSAQANFVSATLLAQQAVVGEYRLPWGGDVVLPAAVQNSLTLPAWRGSTVSAHVTLQPISSNAHLGQVVGTVSSPKTGLSPAGQANVILQKVPTQPAIWWRLLHPMY